MTRRVSCAVHVLLSIVLLIAGQAACARADDAPAQAGTSLASLLRGGGARLDPGIDELSALVKELRGRVHAAVASAVLDSAGRAIAAATQAALDHRDAREVRQKQSAWAALSLADRLIARADADAALRELSGAVTQAEADAQTAAAARTAAAVLDTTRALSRAELERLRRLAPDFFARAERAQADVRLARSADERGDGALRAQLLLDAAVAEADRIALERQRVALEARVLAAEKASAKAEAERRQLAAERASTNAAKLAAERARRAFAELERDDARAVSNAPERAAAREFLVGRARLTLSAARALGAKQLQLTEAEQAIAAVVSEQHERKPTASVGLLASQRALAAALCALGSARAAAAVTTPEQVDDLVARTEELGFSVSRVRGRSGLTIPLPAAFVRGGAALAPAASRKLAPLRDLLAAFPHGDVAVKLHAASGGTGTHARLAEARAQKLASFFAATLKASRVHVLSASTERSGDGSTVPVEPLGADDDGADLVLPAYGGAP